MATMDVSCVKGADPRTEERDDVSERLMKARSTVTGRV